MKIEITEQFKDSMERLFSMNPWYAIPRWLRDARFEIKSAWQRLTRGFDGRMWWSHYYTHSEMMVAVLDEYIKHHIGHPSHMESSEWEKILVDIRDGFQAILEIEDKLPWGDDSSDEYKALDEKFRNGMALYTKHYRNLWD